MLHLARLRTLQRLPRYSYLNYLACHCYEVFTDCRTAQAWDASELTLVANAQARHSRQHQRLMPLSSVSSAMSSARGHEGRSTSPIDPCLPLIQAETLRALSSIACRHRATLPLCLNTSQPSVILRANLVKLVILFGHLATSRDSARPGRSGHGSAQQ